MRKKIDVQDLRPGMYVSELDRPWRETPFLFQGFAVRSFAEIEEVKKYCEYVFIDTDMQQPAKRASHEDQALELELLKKNAQPRRQPLVYEDQISFEEELEPARETYQECKTLVFEIMEDARVGRSLNTEGARKNVETMTASILRNPDALLCLTHLKKKDEYTVLHSLRVCILTLSFGRHLGLPKEQLQELGLGALLHDVGKMSIPNEILNKPGRLTEEEFAVMKGHVPAGVKILQKSSGVPRTALEVASFHHERYDGNGYIYGLKGEQIAKAGLMAALVDCYDAITSDRAYHDGISPHQALKKMYTWRNKAFQDVLTEQFIQCMGIYPIGSLVELNTGHVGVVMAINRARYLRPKVVMVMNGEKKRYPAPRVVDLMMQMRDETNRPWEIKTVLEPGSHGVRPADFLPLHRGALRMSV